MSVKFKIIVISGAGLGLIGLGTMAMSVPANAGTNVDGFVGDADSVGIDSALVQFTEFDNPNNVYSTWTNASGDSIGFYQLNVGDVGIDDDKPDHNKPKNFGLYQNYPNPFNPATTIKFEIPRRTNVSLKIYNIKGQGVANLVNTEMGRGIHEINWDGRSNDGNIIADGIYIYQLKAGDYSDEKRMLFMKGAHTSADRSPTNLRLGKQTVLLDDVLYQMEVTKEGIIHPFQQMVELDNDTTINVTVERILRQIHGQITDFFTHQPVESVKVVSNIDSALTGANGNYSVPASGREVHLALIKNGYLESGVIIPAGIENVNLDWMIVKYDSSTGIDSTFFRDVMLSDRRNNVPDGLYVGMTSESAPDTVYIGGHIVRESDGVTLSYGWLSVAQLNAIAKNINVDVNEYLEGLLGPNSVIAIADSNFAHPDSIANFDYDNMEVVSQDLFPRNLHGKATVRSKLSGTGGNSTSYEDDFTINGFTVRLYKYLTLEGINDVNNSELYSALKGGIEGRNENSTFPSIISEYGHPEDGNPSPHDIISSLFIQDRVARGKWWYPDVPDGFNNPFVIIPVIILYRR